MLWFAGPSLQAIILFEKYGQHQPLNRQTDCYAHKGIDTPSRLGELLPYAEMERLRVAA